MAEDLAVVDGVEAQRTGGAASVDGGIKNRHIIVGRPHAGQTEAQPGWPGKLIVEHQAPGVGRTPTTGDDGDVGIGQQNILGVGQVARVLRLRAVAAGGVGGGRASDCGVEHPLKVGKVARSFDLGF